MSILSCLPAELQLHWHTCRHALVSRASRPGSVFSAASEACSALPAVGGHIPTSTLPLCTDAEGNFEQPPPPIVAMGHHDGPGSPLAAAQSKVSLASRQKRLRGSRAGSGSGDGDGGVWPNGAETADNGTLPDVDDSSHGSHSVHAENIFTQQRQSALQHETPPSRHRGK